MTAAAPSSTAAGSSRSNSTHLDASLNSLLQAILQPITAANAPRRNCNQKIQTAIAQPGASLVQASATEGAPSRVVQASEMPDKTSFRRTADQAAQMLAHNVLMAAYCGSNLPQAAKRQLQETSVFQTCCTALLQSGAAKASWLDCAWGTANILQIAAGEPEQRILVRSRA